jgi:hypothetical protein
MADETPLKLNVEDVRFLQYLHIDPGEYVFGKPVVFRHACEFSWPLEGNLHDLVDTCAALEEKGVRISTGQYLGLLRVLNEPKSVREYLRAEVVNIRYAVLSGQMSYRDLIPAAYIENFAVAVVGNALRTP